MLLIVNKLVDLQCRVFQEDPQGDAFELFSLFFNQCSVDLPIECSRQII